MSDVTAVLCTVRVEHSSLSPSLLLLHWPAERRLRSHDLLDFRASCCKTHVDCMRRNKEKLKLSLSLLLLLLAVVQLTQRQEVQRQRRGLTCDVLSCSTSCFTHKSISVSSQSQCDSSYREVTHHICAAERLNIKLLYNISTCWTNKRSTCPCVSMLWQSAHVYVSVQTESSLLMDNDVMRRLNSGSQTWGTSCFLSVCSLIGPFWSNSEQQLI